MGKKKANKEELAEDWCFVCKDGGDVRICDHKKCLKSYHPGCIKKDVSFLDSESHFYCPRHTCSFCRKCAVLQCYTCTYSTCCHGDCIPTADEFLRIKAENGFCNICLKLVLLVEEGKDIDSDGERVDLTDLNSVEGLFMDYYLIVKKANCIELTDIHAARDNLKFRKDIQSGYSSGEYYESDEDQVSDYDCNECPRKRRKTQNRDISKSRNTERTHVKPTKMEFISWGSKPLMDFLSSIGRSTEKISQQDVASIVNKYIKENNLFDPQKRKLVNCDARLHSIFKRKRINKFKVNDLLEPHFAENQNDSDEDEQGSDSDNSNKRPSFIKTKTKLGVERKYQKCKLNKGLSVSHTGFASIVVENINLVYVKRSLLYELARQPESFEEKVIGSFVRIKTDPYDCSTRNSHQLMQVKGVKQASDSENNEEIILLFPTIYKESRISLLSDDIFYERECEELKEKMVAGLLERPTVDPVVVLENRGYWRLGFIAKDRKDRTRERRALVQLVELQQKAEILHKDITKHWISKELALLNKRIEKANEKGWRCQLFEYLEKRKKLEAPAEQARLLDNVPTVIPEIICDSKSSSDDKNPEVLIEEDSPKSVVDGKTHHGSTYPSEKKTPVTEPHNKMYKEPETKACEEVLLSSPQLMKSQRLSANDVVYLLSTGEVDANEMFDDVESSKWCILGPNGEQHKCSLFVLKRLSELTPYALDFKIWREDEEEERAISLREAIQIAFPR